MQVFLDWSGKMSSRKSQEGKQGNRRQKAASRHKKASRQAKVVDRHAKHPSTIEDEIEQWWNRWVAWAMPTKLDPWVPPQLSSVK